MPLNNFGIVEQSSGLLARGAQPDADGFDTLLKLGFDTIYKLNLNKEFGNLAESQFFHPETVIFDPYPPIFTIPEKEAIIETVETIANLINLGDMVYVHCTHGRDRTGLIIGAYRILINKWDFDAVQRERYAYGSNWCIDIPDHKIVEFLKELK